MDKIATFVHAQLWRFAVQFKVHFLIVFKWSMEQKKSTQKRHQLLNAALDVFSLYGFNGASLDEIAQIAEMHKSNIFY